MQKHWHHRVPQVRDDVFFHFTWWTLYLKWWNLNIKWWNLYIKWWNLYKRRARGGHVSTSTSGASNKNINSNWMLRDNVEFPLRNWWFPIENGWLFCHSRNIILGSRSADVSGHVKIIMLQSKTVTFHVSRFWWVEFPTSQTLIFRVHFW